VYLESIKKGTLKVTPQVGGGLLYEGKVGLKSDVPIPRELQELRDKKADIKKKKYEKELRELSETQFERL
jgi:hypothetical protein